jgi:hypothetical protein
LHLAVTWNKLTHKRPHLIAIAERLILKTITHSTTWKTFLTEASLNRSTPSFDIRVAGDVLVNGACN